MTEQACLQRLFPSSEVAVLQKSVFEFTFLTTCRLSSSGHGLYQLATDCKCLFQSVVNTPQWE